MPYHYVSTDTTLQPHTTLSRHPSGRGDTRGFFLFGGVVSPHHLYFAVRGLHAGMNVVTPPSANHALILTGGETTWQNYIISNPYIFQLTMKTALS